MKQFIAFVLLAFLFTMGQAQERTTSEVKRDFEKEFKSLMRELRTADSTKIQALQEKVQNFENEYKAYSDFLNKAVFPDGYDGTIDKLQDQMKESVELVDSRARIAQLESQIQELSGQMNQLSKANDSLMAQLKSMKSEMAKLRETVKALQANIAKRDEVVFALVDSLFVQYDKQQLSNKDINKISSLEKNNVIANIKRSINDNMAFLSSMAISPSDMPNVLMQQRKFENSWKGVGQKLANAYLSSKDRSKEIAEVDGKIAQWRAQVDEAFWKALNGVFANEKLSVQPFNNSEEFYNNIIRFIDDEMNNTGNKESDARLAAYEAFAYKAWGSEVKPVWVPVMKQYSLLTDDRVNEIDTKVKLWYAQVKPANTIVYILVGALVLAVIIGLYLGMKKRPTPPAAA
ncbi:MAG: hypothetical protein H3C35_03410 [Bacteroidetes bacterium]|nr:hypothetical protein [Bacteroidota bacterium]